MNATEKKLADLIREHPHLYDPTRRDYKDSTKGQRSWREIAEAMGKPEEEVKQKWKNLRDKFYKAKKRLVRRWRCFPTRDDDDGGETPAAEERYVPVLYSELAWLSAYVRPRLERGAKEPDEVAGSADDGERAPDKDEKAQMGSLAVVSQSFLESCSSSHQDMGLPQKRKRQTMTETEIGSPDALSSIRDEDELFLLSLLPSIKRLTMKKRMEVRMKFQQVLYAAEFEDQH
ncbi:uncharacterized protein LOC115407662 [Salarias fasciatus]|uniref:uncharacterized protein LOC115407662 n=1 Tax=Salarias fasciatus TaxID=181472 RepID=UPI001176D67B|nr:uncharacterized protein LOC115407662 [Salarias fasciatus]